MTLQLAVITSVQNCHVVYTTSTCTADICLNKPVGNAKEKEVELITIRTACAANLPPPLPEKAPHSLPPRATTPRGAATQTAQAQRVDCTGRNRISTYTCYQTLWIDPIYMSQSKTIKCCIVKKITSFINSSSTVGLWAIVSRTKPPQISKVRSFGTKEGIELH